VLSDLFAPDLVPSFLAEHKDDYGAVLLVESAAHIDSHFSLPGSRGHKEAPTATITEDI
jgi:hypothetical protein